MKISLKITPNAKKSECLGWEDDPKGNHILKLRIAALPLEGKANREIILFLSAFLKIPKSRILFLRGETGRLKMIEIPDETDMSPITGS